LEAERDDCGVDAVERVLELELMLRRDGLAFRQHPLEDLFKKLMGAVFVRIGERGTMNGPYPRVIERGSLGGKPCFDSSKAVLSRELAEEHGHEMIPGTEPVGMNFSFRLADDFLEFKSIKHLQHLPKYGMMMSHSPTPFSIIGYD
jgi:hypothetical protein